MSISGISDRTLGEVAEFRSALDVRGVPVSFLVAPRLKGGYRLDRDATTVDWLIDRRRRGDAVVLHGFDEAATTARRGEFATLPAHEANLRLMAADRILEHLDLRTRIFAAPGWNVSPGALKVLPRNGFRVLAGLAGIVDLVGGHTVRARVLGIGGGFLDRAVVVPDAGAGRRTHGTPRRNRAAGGVGPAAAPPGSPADPARRRRTGDAALVRGPRLPVAAPNLR